MQIQPLNNSAVMAKDAPQYPPQGARWLAWRHRNLALDQVVKHLHASNSTRLLRHNVIGQDLTVFYYASHADVQRVVNDAKSGMNIAYFYPLLDNGNLTTLKYSAEIHHCQKSSEFSFIGERKIKATLPSVDWWQIGMSYNQSLDKSPRSAGSHINVKSKINYGSPVRKLQRWTNLRNQSSLAPTVIQYITKEEAVPRHLIDKYKANVSKSPAELPRTATVMNKIHNQVRWTQVSTRCIRQVKPPTSTITTKSTPQWFSATPNHSTSNPNPRWYPAAPNQECITVEQGGNQVSKENEIRWFQSDPTISL